MPGNSNAAPGARDAAKTNLTFYEALWSQCRLARPERLNTWPTIAELLPYAPERLEVGPGLRPRLPVAGTHFIDLSATVVERLNARDAVARTGEVSVLPFADASFDLVCAFDIIEHVEDDRRALSELSRVLKQDGILMLSVPLHARYWTDFDALVGHVRRYEPEDLAALLAGSGLTPEKSATFGMQPNNRSLLRWGIWFLTHQRSVALFWYNWLLHPWGIFSQKRLKFRVGFLDTCRVQGVAEIVLICRKAVT
jgi:SAM-dependent methyltransferase